MTDSSTPLPPAGWYPDPAGGTAPRWWNGKMWAAANVIPADATPLPSAAAPTATPPVASPPVASPPAATPLAVSPPAIPPIATPSSTPFAAAPYSANAPAANYSYAAPVTAQNAAGNTNTWQIWLIVLLPLLSLFSLFLINTDALLPAATDGPMDSQLRMYSDPGYLVVTISGWLLYFASIPLAIFDRRTLSARGVDSPFHWAFILIGNVVYVIGRSVVVRSRTGQGLAPLWVWIATQVLGIIVTIAFVVSIVSAMVNSF